MKITEKQRTLQVMDLKICMDKIESMINNLQMYCEIAEKAIDNITNKDENIKDNNYERN